MSKYLYKDYINGVSISGLADKYKISKMRVYKEIAEQSIIYGKAVEIIKNNKGIDLSVLKYYSTPQEWNEEFGDDYYLENEQFDVLWELFCK